MKSIFLTIGSAALFSSAITALPTQHTSRAASSANTVDLVIKTGDGDSSVGFSVPVGKTVATADLGNRQAQSGVAASVSSDNTISCKAFSDAAGTIELVDATTKNSVFTSLITVQFGKSSGGIGSVITDAVPIGAFCCVPTQDGFGACSSSNSSTSTTAAAATSTAAAATSTAAAQAPPSKGKTVRVQLNGASELSAQSEIPADNSVVLIAAHPPLFTDVISALIEDAEGLKTPSCTAFSDVSGKNAVGSITETESSLNKSGKAVKVVALKCKSA